MLLLLKIITKTLHFIPPELSHYLALYGLKAVYLCGFKIDLPEEIKYLSGIQFNNKLGIAAGLDKNGDFIDCLASLGVGFIELGTVTPLSQNGNKKPRLFRIRASKALVNKMGFNNKGVDHLVSKLRERKTKIPVGVSIGKNFETPNELAHKDYICCLEKIYEFADYIAINISSPNTKDLRDFEAENKLENLIKPVKERQLELTKDYGYKPLFLKISPDNDQKDVEDICRTLLKFSIDGLICSNTTVNHNHPSGSGGLSGKPLLGPSTETLRIARKFLGDEFPIIASGGVMSKEDYLQKIDSGADLVQIYTGFIYEGPKLINDILNK